MLIKLKQLFPRTKAGNWKQVVALTVENAEQHLCNEVTNPIL